MMSTRVGWRRRHFLKGLGLGLPAAYAWPWHRSQGAAAARGPVRLFIYYIPHGQPIEHVEGPGDDPTQSRVLEPLAPFADRTVVIRGVSMNDGASNHAAIRATLTGFGEGGPDDSIDSLVASTLGVTPHVLGAIPYDEGAGFGTDAYLFKRGTWVRPTESPLVAAEKLLGAGPGPDDTPDESAYRAAALRVTEAELQDLHVSLQPLEREQDKVALHLNAVQSLQAGGGGSVPTSCSDAGPPASVAALQGLNVLEAAHFGLVQTAHLDVVARAMMCGSARVVSLQNLWVNSGLNFGFSGGPGVAKGHHDPISHSWDAAGRSEFATCQRWFYQQLADHVLTPLNQPDPLDPARTVLDNSLIYVCSEVSDGANHNSDASDVWLDGQPHPTYLPCILIGGGGGAVRPGGIVKVDRLHTDVLATLAHVMGVPLTTMGGQAVKAVDEVLA